jgi:tRNA (cytidine/uridine-2'-O-)-methyltransferase
MHVVLYEPDIPGNTGNVGRTCVATGSTLHLVGKLGFSLEDSYLKRSGLDYWDKVKLSRYPDWQAFEAALPPQAELFFFSKKAKRDLWSAPLSLESYLVFGCETTGLPQNLHDQYQDRFYTLPMLEDSVRSLNLSTAVGIVVYEALRQARELASLPL